MRITPVLAALLVTLSSPVFAQIDWLMMNDGNPARTNHLPINTQPSQYHTAWKTQLQADIDKFNYYWLVGVVIADNRVFSSFTKYDDKNRLHQVIYSQDSASGNVLWINDEIGTHDLSLTYHQGKLLAYQTNKTAFVLSAYDFKTGQELYKVPASSRVYSYMPSGKNVYFSVSNQIDLISSLDSDNGSVNWQTPVSSGDSILSDVSINEQLIVTRSADGILAFNPANGTETYKLSIPNVTKGVNTVDAPVLDNQSAYVLFPDVANSVKGILYAIDLNTRAVRWALPDQFALQHLSLSNQQLISTNATLDRINSINTATGKIDWSWNIPADEQIHDSPNSHSPYATVSTNDVVFIACRHHVYGISLSTHQVVWQGEQSARYLALGDDKLFIILNSADNHMKMEAIALK
jgi:outer membrane protein assembly factor BamB